LQGPAPGAEVRPNDGHSIDIGQMWLSKIYIDDLRLIHVGQ
jgi:hypothetical protein